MEPNSVHIFIQARMGSTRLPGKVLMPLGPRTVLGTMVARLKPYFEHITVLTTVEREDDAIVTWCHAHGVGVFRGNQDDVLSRFKEAAITLPHDAIIVRLTADCPMIDGKIVSVIVETLKTNQADYASNTLTRTYPRGFDAEAFWVRTLFAVDSHKRYDKEHVTPAMYQSGQFRLENVADTQNYAHVRLTLDERVDYEVIDALLKECHYDVSYDYETLKVLLDRSGEIIVRNASVVQKS